MDHTTIPMEHTPPLLHPTMTYGNITTDAISPVVKHHDDKKATHNHLSSCTTQHNPPLLPMVTTGTSIIGPYEPMRSISLSAFHIPQHQDAYDTYHMFSSILEQQHGDALICNKRAQITRSHFCTPLCIQTWNRIHTLKDKAWYHLSEISPHYGFTTCMDRVQHCADAFTLLNKHSNLEASYDTEADIVGTTTHSSTRASNGSARSPADTDSALRNCTIHQQQQHQYPQKRWYRYLAMARLSERHVLILRCIQDDALSDQGGPSLPNHPNHFTYSICMGTEDARGTLLLHQCATFTFLIDRMVGDDSWRGHGVRSVVPRIYWLQENGCLLIIWSLHPEATNHKQDEITNSVMSESHAENQRDDDDASYEEQRSRRPPRPQPHHEIHCWTWSTMAQGGCSPFSFLDETIKSYQQHPGMAPTGHHTAPSSVHNP